MGTTEPRWEPTDDFPFNDVRWQHCDDRIIPGTIEVDSTASNAYGPPIYVQFQRDGATVGMWFDLETWNAMHQAGLTAHAQRTAMTESGWT